MMVLAKNERCTFKNIDVHSKICQLAASKNLKFWKIMFYIVFGILLTLPTYNSLVYKLYQKRQIKNNSRNGVNAQCVLFTVMIICLCREFYLKPFNREIFLLGFDQYIEAELSNK